ncbi:MULTISPECIES: amino acid ABC transporter permease [Brachybacterium]|uniref:Amino acid ABC transporter permease n=2 Tax=Brachybacterium TaxID=43668 RepID=A0A3R8X3Y7_9MICO|nr:MULTISPECIES: amino acid ABC transporter permease [Brachybacterium]RRR17249.1 amino acid ABC transporter permease [Brachybacterium paraconglomeratum]GLI29406.1 amino acid ABC transporter permease [Brachybacterium conglomeratum]GLK06045.1 amino acid ABC transporter permease [Brachybacterium conglomeratum]
MTSSVVTHDTARRADAPGAASGTDIMSCPPETGPEDRASLGPISDEELSRLRVVPARHPGRIVLAVLVGLLAAAVLWSFVTNPRWEWGVVAQWFFAESIIRGLLETLKLTVLAGAVGFGLGLVLALMRLSNSSLISSVSWTFSWIFRSTPLLVQLLLWYNLGYLYESITLGIPLTDVTFVDARTSDLMTPMIAAVLGLGLHQAAYAAELIRGGILSVDQGQIEAASALGIPARDRSLRIVLPQAMRAILPTAFNEIIGLVKGTSIVYVLAHAELFFTVQLIYGRTQQVLPMLLVATVWYVVITSLLSIGQYYIERHYSKGAVRTLPPTPLQRLRARLGRRPVTAGAAA